MKRFLSLLLALALVIACTPVAPLTVRADNTATPGIEGEAIENPFGSIDNVGTGGDTSDSTSDGTDTPDKEGGVVDNPFVNDTLPDEDVTSGTFGSDVTWVVDDNGILTISGTGYIDDCFYEPAPWDACSDSIVEVVITEGITGIGECAFTNCNPVNVTIPDSVTYIDGDAFAGCTLLNLTIGSGVAVIGECAFLGCTIYNLYYAGTQAQWEAIQIDTSNDLFLNDATIHYNHIHDYSLFEPVVVAATCTEKGYTQHTCVYGEIFDTKFVPALGHNYSGEVTVVSSTCTEKGYTQTQCIRCEAMQKTKYTAALGHNCPSVETVKDSTCTEEGETVGQCANCGATITGTIAALGHSMVAVTAVDATCTSDGLTVGTKCERCDFIGVAQTTVPATGHNYENGICTDCGLVEEPAENTLTIEEAIALGASQGHNVYTDEKYYVTGVVTEVYNPTYGNMRIADEAGNILVVYGSYSADGTVRYDAMEVKPVAGDMVTVYGVVGQYNGTAQIKNGWITELISGGREETPAFDSVLTIEEAIAMGAKMESDTYTEGKYYVTGVITEIYDATIGGLKISDEAGNILTINGTYSAAGAVRFDKLGHGGGAEYAGLDIKPVVGDTILIYGVVGQSNGEVQIKDGWLQGHTMTTDPAADTVLTVAEAIALGLKRGNKFFTVSKYYVTGVITEVTETTYGTMKITDDAGNLLTVYGTYNADGTVRYDAMDVKPVVGDTITVYGGVGHYYGTPEINNGWITEHIVADPETPSEPESDTLTVEEAAALGNSKEKDVYTEEKYYVTGVITEVSGTTYGNMYITDGNGNYLYIYGTYNADGTVRYDAMDPKPDEGDTVTLYGVIGKYNDPQMKNAWIIDFTPGELEEEEPEGESATITFDDTAKRTEGDKTHQVWVENGITVTNNKNASTSDVNTNYYNPVRFYKSSAVVVSYAAGFERIVFNCNTASYATVLQNSITSGTVTVENDVVTVVFDAHITSFEVVVTGQVRVDNITVYTTGHTYEAVVTAPTCTEDGYTTYACTVCGEGYIADEVPATGHSYSWLYEKWEATCENDGMEAYYTCGICGQHFDEDKNEVAYEDLIIPAPGHDYSIEVIKPTCIHEGFTRYTCNGCGNMYITDELPEAGHNYNTVVTAPTCTDGGYTTYTCLNCDDIYTSDLVEPAGHKYDKEVHLPDCEVGGYTYYTCSVCGDFRIDDETSPTGHSYAAVVTAPTCIDGGYTTYTCSVCGYSYIADEISAIGHNYEPTDTVLAPSCTQSGYVGYTCTNCSDSYTEEIPANGHDYGQWIEEIPAQIGQTGVKGHYCCAVCEQYFDENKNAVNYADLVIPALTQNAPQIELESKTVVKGKEFTVTAMVKNNPGFCYLEVTPVIPDAFTLVKVENGELISDFTQGKQYVWIADENVTADGLLLTFTFLVDDSIETGNYEVSLNVRTCGNYDEEPVTLYVASGEIEVIDFIYGDANGDNVIDGFDVIRLKKYLANYDYDTETSTVEIGAGADANGDGKVDGFDVIRLKKYLANYDYETGESTIVLGPQ